MQNVDVCIYILELNSVCVFQRKSQIMNSTKPEGCTPKNVTFKEEGTNGKQKNRTSKMN